MAGAVGTADEQQLRLAEAAHGLQRRALAQRTLLTLELGHADDALCAAHAAAMLERRRVEQASSHEARLQRQLEAACDAICRWVLRSIRFAV
jgi:hypothetical protein